MNLIPTQPLWLGILADVTTAVTGILTGSEMELSVTDITPTPDTLIGAYTLATYVGYAAGTVTWLAPSIADDGTIELVGTVPEFRPTNGVTPNQIYTAIITDGGGGLHFGARFDDAPIPMVSALNSIVPTLRVRITPSGIVAVVS